MECHACFEWLFLVLEPFRHSWPEVDVDIRAGLAFDAFPGLLREEVDLVITSDPITLPGVVFNPLFDYHPMFVAASTNPLAQKPMITAEDFRDQLLITYPVARDKLDVFTELLTPAKIEPRATRQVELTAMILMLVAANRGVSVLPDWVLRDVQTNADFVTLPLGPEPVIKRLYAATRAEDATKPFMANFLRLSRSEPVKLQRSL
jgi:LysR family transcriptional regulator for metE and metH